MTTAQAKHTPLMACNPGDYGDFDGCSIVILTSELHPRRVAVVQGDDDESIATAALFAAAPDLLAALQSLTGMYTARTESGKVEASCKPFSGESDKAIEAAWLAAVGVIAKAFPATPL